MKGKKLKLSPWKIPTRSFQFRLLIYLLVIGAVPLICAIYVFYRQSSDYAQHELKQYVEQLNEQSIQRITRELSEFKVSLSYLNSDVVMQQFMQAKPSAAGSPEFTENQLSDEVFKDRMNFLINLEKTNNRYISDLCISLPERQISICRDSAMIAFDPQKLPLTKFDLIYRVPYTSGDKEASPNTLQFVGPLFNLQDGVIKGYIVININMQILINDLRTETPILKHVIYDSQSNVIYSSEGRTVPSREQALPSDLNVEEFTKLDGSRVISQKKLTYPGLNWISHIEIKNNLWTSNWRSLQNTIIVFFIILFMISAISSVVFSRIVTKPIHTLRGLMKRAELGDLKAYWAAGGPLEINDLGESYNQMLNRLEETFKQVKLEEALKKEAKIEALQYQLNPHFLYNTLNTIKWVAKIHKTPQISEAVSSLVRLLQASLGKKGDFITLREEVELLNDYVDIQRFRYGDQVKFMTEVESVASLCLVPRLILQPLVENALIHGIQPQQVDGTIVVRAWIERDLLLCEVEDNGKGIHASELDLHEEKADEHYRSRERMSGIGLHHIREKIKVYYGANYSMRVLERQERGTTIRLTLPVHMMEE